MSLKVRKVLYASLTLVACAVWLPLGFAAIAFIVGAIGLLSIGSLIRAIYALPITNQLSRRYFSATIGIGIALMGGFVVLAVADQGPRALLLPVASGILLLGVGLAVLVEINVKHA